MLLPSGMENWIFILMYDARKKTHASSFRLLSRRSSDRKRPEVFAYFDCVHTEERETLIAHLHDVGCVRAVVISVYVVIMGLDNNQPRSKRQFVAIESVEDIEAPEKFHAQEHQRLLLGQLFETENLKVPIESVRQHLHD